MLFSECDLLFEYNTPFFMVGSGLLDTSDNLLSESTVVRLQRIDRFNKGFQSVKNWFKVYQIQRQHRSLNNKVART